MVTLRKSSDTYPFIATVKNVFIFVYASLVAYAITHNYEDYTYSFFIIVVASVHFGVRLYQMKVVWNQLGLKTIEYLRREQVNRRIEILSLFPWLLLYLYSFQAFGVNEIGFTLVNSLLLVVSIGFVLDAYLMGNSSIVAAIALFAPSILFYFYFSYQNMNEPIFYIIITCIFLAFLAFHVSSQLYQYMEKDDVSTQAIKKGEVSSQVLSSMQDQILKQKDILVAEIYGHFNSDEKKDIDICKEVKSIADTYEEQFSQANIELIFEDGGQNFYKSMNPKNLEFSLKSILDNALEVFSASENNEISPKKIMINIEKGQTDIAIYLSNNGEKLDPFVYDNVFQQFYSTKDDHKGLSLTIARSLMRAIDGDIAAITKDDMFDTTFKITIPA